MVVVRLEPGLQGHAKPPTWYSRAAPACQQEHHRHPSPCSSAFTRLDVSKLSLQHNCCQLLTTRRFDGYYQIVGKAQCKPTDSLSVGGQDIHGDPRGPWAAADLGRSAPMAGPLTSEGVAAAGKRRDAAEGRDSPGDSLVHPGRVLLACQTCAACCCCCCLHAQDLQLCIAYDHCKGVLSAGLSCCWLGL